MDNKSKIFVAGHLGLVGSSITKKLQKEGYENLILVSSRECDLTNQNLVRKFFDKNRPEYVFLAAAKCGGILDNITYPVEYILNNLNIQNNVISMSHEFGVKKLIFFASSCVYSKNSNIPIREDCLMSGPLEKTHEFYSIAKISGIKLCEAYARQYGCNFVSVNPCNIYGIDNKINSPNAHVMSSLTYKIWKAKKENIDFVECFGDGSPKREFLYSDDLADASLFLMNSDIHDSFINIGTGIETSIMEIVELICKILDYRGKIVWDISKPNGSPRRVLDVSKLNSLGWKPKVSLDQGILKIVNHLNVNYA